jgi:hypothetical protein
MSLQQAIEQHELFASPTVLAVANILVKRAKAVGDSPTKPQKSIESVAAELVVEYDKFYPASYAQEQTYVLNASGAGAAYNMPWIVDFKGKFDKEAMIRAHDLVVKREQPLRTILRLNPSLSTTSDGTVQQCVLPQHDSRNYWDLCEHNAWTYEEAISILEEAQDYNFDLTQTPVSRLHIVQINNDDGRHLVMCNSHHVHHDTGSVVTYRRHVVSEIYCNNLVLAKGLYMFVFTRPFILTYHRWKPTLPYAGRNKSMFLAQNPPWTTSLMQFGSVKF